MCVWYVCAPWCLRCESFCLQMFRSDFRIFVWFHFIFERGKSILIQLYQKSWFHAHVLTDIHPYIFWRKYYFTREESNCKLSKNLELKWKLWNMRKVEPSILYASWFSDGNVFIFHVSAFVSYLLQLTFSHFCLKSRLKTESWLCSFQNANSYQQRYFLQI